MFLVMRGRYVISHLFCWEDSLSVLMVSGTVFEISLSVLAEGYTTLTQRSLRLAGLPITRENGISFNLCNTPFAIS